MACWAASAASCKSVDSTGSSVGKTTSRSRSTVAAIEGGGIGEMFLRIPVWCRERPERQMEKEATQKHTTSEDAEGGGALIRRCDFVLAVRLRCGLIRPHDGKETCGILRIGSHFLDNGTILVRKDVQALSYSHGDDVSLPNILTETEQILPAEATVDSGNFSLAAKKDIKNGTSDISLMEFRALFEVSLVFVS